MAKSAREMNLANAQCKVTLQNSYTTKLKEGIRGGNREGATRGCADLATGVKDAQRLLTEHRVASKSEGDFYRTQRPDNVYVSSSSINLV